MNVISHRGAKGLAPENSLASFEIADSLRPAYIEFDIQTTKDNIAVVYHNKYTRNGRPIDSYSYLDLIKEDPTIITLEQTINVIVKSKPLIELKYVKNAFDIANIISGSPAFTSFNQQQIFNLNNSWQGELYIMQRKHPFGIIKKAKSNGVTGVGINKNWLILLPIYYKLCHKNNLKLYIYTLNNILLAKIVSKLLPNIYICTDFPNRLLGK